MALRVLLADESSTIKKVFQLALQDYAVDVVAVNSGDDVLPVAARFKPDIIFADVLLQQQSGYEVSSIIKTNPELNQLPVVLIWSGFMELDQDKFQASQADGHLEKPFDAKKLRELVQRLVPKTKTQSLADYLSFPKLPELEDGPAHAPAPQPAGDFETIEPAGTESPEANWDMDSFEPMSEVEAQGPIADEFQEINIPKAKPEEPAHEIAEVVTEGDDEDENEWMQKTLTNFKLKIPQDEDPEDTLQVAYEVPEDNIEGDAFISDEEPTEQTATSDLELDLEPVHEEPPIEEPLQQREAPQVAATHHALSEEELETIIRSQAKEMLEAVIWRVVPELATQMIEREINRLLTERESKS